MVRGPAARQRAGPRAGRRRPGLAARGQGFDEGWADPLAGEAAKPRPRDKIAGDVDWAVHYLAPWLGKGIRRIPPGRGIEPKRPVPIVVPKSSEVSIIATVVTFEGQIAGLGSSSRRTAGRRALGTHSPLRRFRRRDGRAGRGRRVLLAPSHGVADLFEQRTGSTRPFSALRSRHRGGAGGSPGRAGGLGSTSASRTRLGRLLSLVPRRLATAPRWLTLINPAAQLIMKGVRPVAVPATDGPSSTARTTCGPVDAAGGRWRGTELGTWPRVDPPVRFGFRLHRRRA